MTTFLAYSPVFLFVSSFGTFLLGTALARLVRSGEGAKTFRLELGVVLLALCGLFEVITIPVGLKLLLGILTGLTIGGCATVSPKKVPSPDLGSTVTVLSVLGIVLLAAGVRIPNLGEFGLRIDEPKHLKTALGYLRTGEYVKWDFVRKEPGDAYSRAFLHTKSIALSFRIFGENLGTARLVSFLWGLLLFVPLWGLATILQLRNYERILLFFWVALSPYFMSLSRWMRFYSAFTTLLLAALVCLYWFLHDGRTRKAYWYGGLGMVCLILALHLQLVGFLCLVGIGGYLAASHFLEGETGVSMTRLLVAGVATVGLVFFVMSEPGRWFFYLSDSGSTWGELAGTLTFRPLYATYLFGEPYGYLIGGLILAVLFVYREGHSREQYFYWLVAVPLLGFVLGARRFPQVRFVGHLYPISFALLLLGTRRICSVLSQGRQLVYCLLFGFLTVIVPLYSLPVDLNRVWAGEMGYVGFPGTDSPRYSNWIRDFPPLVNQGDVVAIYNLPDYYAPRLKDTGATLDWVSRSKQPQPALTVKDLRQYAQRYERVWVVTLRRFHGLENDVVQHLETYYRKVTVPKVYGNIVIYYREGVPRAAATG